MREWGFLFIERPSPVGDSLGRADRDAYFIGVLGRPLQADRRQARALSGRGLGLGVRNWKL
jgi:hypothetical protein